MIAANREAPPILNERDEDCAPDGCWNCVYWDFQRDDVGYCRADTPTRNEAGMGVWPLTLSDDWCGEHDPGDDAECDEGAASADDHDDHSVF